VLGDLAPSRLLEARRPLLPAEDTDTASARGVDEHEAAGLNRAAEFPRSLPLTLTNPHHIAEFLRSLPLTLTNPHHIAEL
jgi:hypothetical protein